MPASGSEIESIEAVGKHLLIHFGDGVSLRTHMGMTGSWHLYPVGERWRKGRHLARVVIEADNDWLAVCFSPPTVELYHRQLQGSTVIAHLGPDLLASDVDYAVVMARCARWAGDHGTIAEVLLDQRVACGIGNVYKSEALFVCGVDPFAPPAAVPDALRLELYQEASAQLHANLDRPQRVTYRGGLGVYGRQQQDCRRCGGTVRMRHHGAQGRSTYWCGQCQVLPAIEPI